MLGQAPGSPGTDWRVRDERGGRSIGVWAPVVHQRPLAACATHILSGPPWRHAPLAEGSLRHREESLKLRFQSPGGGGWCYIVRVAEIPLGP